VARSDRRRPRNTGIRPCDVGGRHVSPDGVIADGAIHAFHVDGDRRGSKNGRYQLHADGRPAGWFGSHKIGLWHKWSAADQGTPTVAERAAYAVRIANLKAARDAERMEIQEAARRRAAGLWQRARPATNDHPYLVRKSVRAYGTRILRMQLLVPVRDSAGVLCSLQFIGAGRPQNLSHRWT
jgi:putative DNA primase/helicase